MIGVDTGGDRNGDGWWADCDGKWRRRQNVISDRRRDKH